ncbi:MAG: hypothetical protein GY765_16580, partial [bacterium]|nr:hypothetical protein [bacterium]
LLDTALHPEKPEQSKPMAEERYAFDDMLTGEEKAKIPDKDELRDYLAVLNLFVNNSCSLDCLMCNKAHKQFLCCTRRGSKPAELDVNLIRQFFETHSLPALTRINVSGGNITGYSKINQLTELLAGLEVIKNYVLHYRNAYEAKDFLQLIGDKRNRLSLLVSFPLDKSAFKTCFDLVKRYPVNVGYTFIVENDDQIEAAQNLISEFSIEDAVFAPFYNGANISFFKEHVFPDEESILE